MNLKNMVNLIIHGSTRLLCTTHFNLQSGEDPLFVTSQNGFTNIAILLIKKGARIDERNGVV